jgi:hypothetical protein
MDQLRSLQDQLAALQMVFDQAIKEGKTFDDVKGVYLQVKDIQKKIYERKITLKRDGSITGD